MLVRLLVEVAQVFAAGLLPLGNGNGGMDYQMLTGALKRRQLRDRLLQAEAQHYEIATRMELFEAQEDENKADVLDKVRVELEQASVSVRMLQGMLAGLEREIGDNEGVAEARKVYDETE